MKIKFLGTAAFEAFPAIGCSCDACKRAWAAGGRNLRSRTQAMVNDDLMIDFPEDAIWHFMQYRIDYDRIGACLITHSHSDHLSVPTIEGLGTNFTKSDRTEPLHFFAGASGYEKLKTITDRPHVQPRADATEVRAYVPFTAAGYDVLPVAATHDPHSTPLNYRIAREGKSLLYAHDTGVYNDATWEALSAAGRVDLVSLDCTAALLAYRYTNHLDYTTALAVFAEMERRGIIDARTVRVVNHFSHNGLATYDDLLPLATEQGILVTYDGMEVEF